VKSASIKYCISGELCRPSALRALPTGTKQQEIGGEYQKPSAFADYVSLMIIPVVGFAIFAISVLFIPLSAIAFAE
jgi:hypothetical protein